MGNSQSDRMVQKWSPFTSVGLVCAVLLGQCHLAITAPVMNGTAPAPQEEITLVQLETAKIGHTHDLPEPYHKTNAVLSFIQSLSSDCKTGNFKLEMRKAKELMDLEMNIKPVSKGKSDEFFDHQVKNVQSNLMLQTEATTTTTAEASTAQQQLPESWVDKSTPPNELPVLRVSMPGQGVAGSNDKKLSAFLMFGEHGRELISCEIGMAFLQTIHDAVCNDAPSANSASTQHLAQQEAITSNVLQPALTSLLEIEESQYATSTPYSVDQVRHLLQSWDLTIMPIASPSAREIAEQSDFCNRKNSHRVDVNRNYPFHFGEGGHSSSSEQFPGTAPLTEPETRLAADLAQEIHPKLFISVHSGAEMVVTSPAYRKVRLDQLPEGVQKVVRGIKAEDCPECNVGPASQVLSYLAYGCSMDYMFEQGFSSEADPTKPSQEHFAFTFETWAGDQEERNVQQMDLERTFGSQTAKDISRQMQSFNALKSQVGDEQFTCLTRFNPPPSMYPLVVAKWSKALFSTMDAVQKDLVTKM
eukprot:c11762_g1_i1.p1 GENE.c11762_g1_i1~~c11762_g1_i1.p1  ORF type:complete len:529 (+),score=157.45 c11762_g1_i1:1-1587(+)